MSIKSEKAKAAIKDVIPMYIAEKAVELAESDARKRAVRVFCKTVCPKQHEGCSCYGLSCDKRDDFLKLYDNE